MTDKRIVLSTAGSEQEARRIAQHLLVNRLAACVNIVPGVESIYLWQGKIESGREWLILIKTTADLCSSVQEAIATLHSYEVPECVVLTVEDGSADYLGWIENSVRGDS